MNKLGLFFLRRPLLVIWSVLLLTIVLPVAVWFDVRNITDKNLRAQAASLNQIVSVFRSYYASNVVDRVVDANGTAVPLHNYLETDGGIPIPATLSIELGELLGAQSDNLKFRFVSDYPFKGREPYTLTDFERSALDKFFKNPTEHELFSTAIGRINDRVFTVATPVVMGEACVTCHNTHPESPRKDWEVGDIRGIQTISVSQPMTLGLSSFRWLFTYMLVAGDILLIFGIAQFRLASEFDRVNNELATKNSSLLNISNKLSKYFPPQIFASIFSGEKEVEISTERKKLTVFFSDIKDFTSTTERLQPEELTALLNEYFSEMSKIAERHGATIDKFIGDAIVAFFGDPVSRGAGEDARACVAMAMDMQKRLYELNQEWHQRGYEHPFRARMGINTGYCNVGNFGSDERMNYTIIGPEANLAERLQTIAKPNGIVMSYETWAHARNVIDARALDPVQFKGIARDVVPYEVIMPDYDVEADNVITQSTAGLELFVNTNSLDEQGREEARTALQRALDAIDKKSGADKPSKSRKGIKAKRKS